MSVECCFHGCASPVVSDSTKCLLHRHRLTCAHEGCGNQVYARGYCVRHGGKRTCSRHALHSTKKHCVEPNCVSFAQANQRCVRHGGGRKCKLVHCCTLARIAGFCQRHAKLLQPKLTRVASRLADDVVAANDALWHLDGMDDLDASILDGVLNHTRPFALPS
ncbi:hypothetical protein SPRG_12759 [Saprolegnia parasitica CBS 223.65]|uniref:Uncharacterized protein n=1 Tax=Saprolegnia parasitica (strain CBS 223.65) TaxID=695850 RepID=A0A067C7D9_SAPPC|nr:hypothetical protein SPRG_12759 [Saprolegnia parasitica CBS 223.65]KDO22476.1 hypothetical protein SPRG_12759 [Saprolegnia parasitica CBS 223.65]|eukprot:XP_012206863.1 hypothetical protein SPRG_12759 [Saprolegnia parasitica CBS 223.65]